MNIRVKRDFRVPGTNILIESGDVIHIREAASTWDEISRICNNETDENLKIVGDTVLWSDLDNYSKAYLTSAAWKAGIYVPKRPNIYKNTLSLGNNPEKVLAFLKDNLDLD